MSGDAQTIQEQNMLIKEAQMQMDALRRLGNWQRVFIDRGDWSDSGCERILYECRNSEGSIWNHIGCVILRDGDCDLDWKKKWKREREKDSGGCSSADFRRLVKIRFIFRICESGHLEMV